MRDRASARLALGALLALATVAAAPAPSRRPLTHRDYDSWRSISSEALSRDGRYLAYAFMPQDGDGEVVVRELASGKERRQAVGALPPPPVQQPEEVNPEEPLPRPSIRLALTSDGAFLVSTTYPPKAETQQAKKQKKKADDMPKGGLLVLSLASGEAVRLPSVKSMQVPARGGSWVAYLKEPRPEEKKPAAEKGDEKKAAADKPAADKKEYGSELVLRDLARGTERVFPNVLEYTFARDGRTLLYAVSSRQEDENGVYVVAPGSEAPPAALLAGKGRYKKLTFDREQRQAAFVSDRDEAGAKAPRFKVYHWTRQASAARELVSAATPGFPADLAVSDKGLLGFSRDGSRLYVPAGAPPPPSKDEDAPADEKVVADLWSWKDDLVQPMQRIRANQERNRTYRGVYHVAEGKYVQVADATLRSVSPSDDGTRAIGFDDRAYRRLVDYDGTYSDLYLVDTASGSRRPVRKQFRGGDGQGGPGGGGPGGGGPLRWSPDGRFAAYYEERHWHLLDAASGAARNLTEGLKAAFHDEDHDTPGPAGSYGSADWTRDGASLLVYDRYDVWQLFADGRPARNLTEGEGRRTRTQLRVQRIEPQEEGDDAPRGIDPAQPLYLRAVSEETRATGFARDSFEGTAPPRRLLWGDRAYRYLGRAREADVLLLSASRFDEFPDLHTTDSTFQRLAKVTSGGAQLEPFLWGKAELLRFKSADGLPLQAGLYKPAGFDPRKKYPLLVYIYERLSQNVHNFQHPAPGTSINVPFYVSNGYVVLTPDIAYTVGSPGPSALKCVLPAIQAAVDQGFVDEEAIGIQGHSWGGYQIAYMITQTNRFRAAEAGAPVGNMTSAYSGIRWGSGLPRQFQYEKTQSRISRSLYEAPLKYIENSAVFHADRVRTPLLILHNDQDDAVPWYQGIELFLALRRTGKEVYLWNYNNEFHGLRRRHNQKDYTLRMQQFFDHYLKGAPRPEWMEKGIPFLEREAEKESVWQAAGVDPPAPRP